MSFLMFCHLGGVYMTRTQGLAYSSRAGFHRVCTWKKNQPSCYSWLILANSIKWLLCSLFLLCLNSRIKSTKLKWILFLECKFFKDLSLRDPACDVAYIGGREHLNIWDDLWWFEQKHLANITTFERNRGFQKIGTKSYYSSISLLQY